MRTLLILISLVTALSVNADVICKKEGRYWRPSNDNAKAIAKALKVTTCSGGKFQAAVKASGQKFNVPLRSKTKNIAAVIADLKGK